MESTARQIGSLLEEVLATADGPAVGRLKEVIADYEAAFPDAVKGFRTNPMLYAMWTAVKRGVSAT